MIRFYTPIMILQGYCLYHAYQNKSAYYWYILIAVVPLLGCLFYLYSHFYSRDNVDTVVETVKRTVNSNYTVEKLLAEAQVSDTIAAKVRLADEYMNREKFDQAIVLYESCLTGFNAEDPDTMKKLLFSYYENERYEDVERIGTSLLNQKAFQNSDAKLAYAWSKFHLGETTAAERHFEELNVRYSNHEYRAAYAYFLLESNQKEKASALLNELQDEVNHMDAHEKRLKKEAIKDIKILVQRI